MCAVGLDRDAIITLSMVARRSICLPTQDMSLTSPGYLAFTMTRSPKRQSELTIILVRPSANPSPVSGATQQTQQASSRARPQ